MGNCIPKSQHKYALIRNSDFDEMDVSEIQINEHEYRCRLTELPFTQCNCGRCLNIFPPYNLNGDKQISYFVKDNKLYCKYANTQMDPIDVSSHKDIGCKRGGKLYMVLFNGHEVSYI